MIIGDWSVIPENIERAYVEWLPNVPTHRFMMILTDGGYIEQFTMSEKDARGWLKLADKAITDSREVRDKLRQPIILDMRDDEEE